MIEYTDEVHIDAPPAEVWAVITDADRASVWMSVVRSAERDGPLEAGSTVRSRASFLGLSFDVENEITEADEPHRYALHGQKPFPTSLLFELSVSGGGTDVRATTRVDPGKFFPVPGAVLKRQVKKQMEADSRNLKKLVEQGS
ncbi:MAG TPA: SRPBCC family protein [Nitriliruptorales bacterium]